MLTARIVCNRPRKLLNSRRTYTIRFCVLFYIVGFVLILQTIDEMKEKRQTEINLTTRELEQDFESRLTEELQRYRNELDAELFRQRNQLTGMYEDKVCLISC